MLVLLDTERRRRPQRASPVRHGLTTTKAEYAAVLAGGSTRHARPTCATGTPQPTFTARDATPDGWTQRRSRRRIPGLTASSGDRRRRAGTPRHGLADVANVAFRTAEPVREWFDKHQALALHAGTIDTSSRAVDTAGAEGRRQRALGARAPATTSAVFTSTEPISTRGRRGRHPPALRRLLPGGLRRRPKATPLQLWLHWRGGKAHSAGAATPGMFRDLGERHDAIVVSPRGRGTSSWYVGTGHVDVERGLGRRPPALQGRRQPPLRRRATRWAAWARSS